MKHNYPLEMQERVLSLVSEGLSITAASKEACREYNYPYDDSVRRQFSKKINAINDDAMENINYTDTNQYGTDTQLSARKSDGTLMNIEEYCSIYGIPFEQVRTYKLVTHTGTPYYNIASNVIKNEDLGNLYELFLEDLKSYAPKYNTYKRESYSDGHLLIVDPADIHIGKLCNAFETGETYNNQIAVQRVMSGVNGILNKVSSFNIDKILFVIGNDILHIDNPKRTTTRGTPQDTDGMWHSNFLIAKQLYVDIIEKLMCVADVEVVFNPSNHDYTNGFFLAQLIETHFRSCSNVKFDCSISHRKYFVYGENLIGTTHGDGAKQQDLPLLMANESKDWTNCKHKYFYIHHFHHKISKDYMNVCVESLRTPSGTDSWHHRNGYQHAPKAVEGFIHDKNNGQIARITHLF
jgi:hypothetical protein